FEIEGNEEDTVNFTSGEHTQIRIHPSPPQDEHKKDVMATVEIVNLMELPPIVLLGDLFTTGSRDIYYLHPLLDLWMKNPTSPCLSF
ncbi:PREDICTED: sister chromatid cohesion 1, partial [Prunus dulcis]